MSKFDIDSLEQRILSVGKKSIGTSAGLTAEEIVYLCTTVTPILASQSTLLQFNAPCSIVGDIHGHFHDLLRIFDTIGYPQNTNYLFLGNYVDYGENSIEVICLLFIYKIKYPDTFFMLRGNHECSYINRKYGFFDTISYEYNNVVWVKFCEVFNYLPLAAIINDKIFCVHGGLSPSLKSLFDIKNIQRPVEIPDEGLICDLVWSDPEPDIEDWGENKKGTSYCFGLNTVNKFLNAHNFDIICRSGQAIENGYEFPFPDSESLVTIYSAPNYCYDHYNAGAILSVDENLFCNFSTFEAMNYKESLFKG